MPSLRRAGGRSSLVLALVLAATLGACTHTIPRNRVSDFFAKAAAIKPSKRDAQPLARPRHRVRPSPAAAAMGMSGAAYAGGYGDAWRVGAGGAVGAIGAASAGAALS